MYVVAFWTAWFMLPGLGKIRGVSLSRDQWTNIVAWGALGVLVGGRLGYALFYEPLYFLQSPIELFFIWNGGMSSHGGFIGAALGVWWATRSPFLTKERLGEVSDVLTVPVALGLALGRIGNIINQEFGMYPYYEAIGDVCIAVICYVLLRRRGTTFPVFLLLYSILRFFLECVRPQDWPLVFGLSRGQLLTIPLFIGAVILLKNANKRRISETI